VIRLDHTLSKCQLFMNTLGHKVIRFKLDLSEIGCRVYVCVFLLFKMNTYEFYSAVHICVVFELLVQICN
jgi:hypothetical protein